MYAGKEVPKSPFNVMVEGHAGDPSKVTASGPGLEPTGVMVGKPTYFDIFTKGNFENVLFVYKQMEKLVVQQNGLQE